jgi:hypothetical protein
MKGKRAVSCDYKLNLDSGKGIVKRGNMHLERL